MSPKQSLKTMLSRWLESVAGFHASTARQGVALSRIVSSLGTVESFGSSSSVWEMSLRLRNGKKLTLCLRLEPTSSGSTL